MRIPAISEIGMRNRFTINRVIKTFIGAVKKGTLSDAFFQRQTGLEPWVCFANPSEQSSSGPDLILKSGHIGRGISRSLAVTVLDFCNPFFIKKRYPRKRGYLFLAPDGARTRDLNLGKVALYQLSHWRKHLLSKNSIHTKAFFVKKSSCAGI